MKTVALALILYVGALALVVYVSAPLGPEARAVVWAIACAITLAVPVCIAIVVAWMVRWRRAMRQLDEARARAIVRAMLEYPARPEPLGDVDALWRLARAAADRTRDS